MTFAQKFTLLFLFLVISAIAGGCFYWQYQNPIVNSASKARLYWKEDIAQDYNPTRMVEFPILIDGQTHEYSIEFPSSVKIVGFRFDPVKVPVDNLAVDWLQMMQAPGILAKEFLFNAEEPPWMPETFLHRANIRHENSPEGSYFVVQQRDAFFMSEDFEPISVTQALIKMRIKLTKPLLAYLLNM